MALDETTIERWKRLPARERVVSVCLDVLEEGPMGDDLREEVYRWFINCKMKPAGMIGGAYVDDISSWITSCAMFVRAVLFWSGRPTSIARNGLGIFNYLGTSGYGDKAWTMAAQGRKPKPGDVFYVASTLQANDGHVGVFLYEKEPDVWVTAEGGGSDGPGGAKEGSLCKIGRRSMKAGERFDGWRTLLGWWDVELFGLPDALPEPAPTDEGAEAQSLPPPLEEELPPPQADVWVGVKGGGKID